MRKVLATLVAAVTVGALAPLASHALTASHAARISERLAVRLASAAPDERVVVLVHGTSRAAAVAAVASAGLDQLLVLESIGVPAAAGTPAQIEALRSEPGVTYVEPDAPIELHLDTALQATRTDEAHGMTVPVACAAPGKSGGRGKAPAKTCGSVGPFTGAGQSIAIVDSGVDGTHPMFQRPDGTSKVVRNMKVACIEGVVWFTSFPPDGERFPPNLCPAGESSDRFILDVPANDGDTPSMGGHGTHVASIAAGVATANGDRTLTGTAPGADIVSISVGQGLSILNADVALDWIARNHANPCATAGGTCNPITVVNNSYGPVGGGDFDPESATAKITERLITDGVVMVWANGNGDATNDGGDGSDNRSNPEGQNPLPGVLSVANYDDAGTGTTEGELAPSSSRGHAPRAETWPDVSAPGSDITAACRPYLAVCTSFEDDPNFGTIGGTSMAAPHVAGIVTLLREAKPDITPAQIEDALEDTAHRFAFGAPYGTDPTNTTTPSSFDKGHGLVDTVRALTAVTSGEVASSETPAGAGPCATGGPVLTDPEGDAVQLAVLASAGPNEPALDVRQLDLAWDTASNTVVFTARVTDLGESNPDTSPHASWNITFTYGDAGYYVEAIRSASGEVSFGYGVSAEASVGITGAVVRAPSGAITGALDPATDTIRMELPSAALESMDAPPFATGAVLADFALISRRSATDRVIGQGSAADSSETTCIYTLGTGTGAPPPPPAPEPTPEPEPGTVDATIHDGESFETEATTVGDTSGIPGLDGYSCSGPGDPACFTYRVEAIPAGASTLNVWLDPSLDSAVLDDWDVYVYDADGNEVSEPYAGLVHLHAGPQTVTEIFGVFIDVPEPAVYTILVVPYNVPPDITIGVHADLAAA